MVTSQAPALLKLIAWLADDLSRLDSPRELASAIDDLVDLLELARPLEPALGITRPNDLDRAFDLAFNDRHHAPAVPA